MKERKERAGQKREKRWVKMSGGEWGQVGGMWELKNLT